jgi:hypothetical protein
VALGNQLLANVDLVFASLQGCFSDPLDRKSFWLVLQALSADVDRIVDLSVPRLRAIAAHNGVRPAEHAYRASGLVPSHYQSAVTNRRGGIARERSAALRHAIVEMGRGLAQHDAHFAAYRRSLLARGKRPKIANIAVGHRADRLAFALIRTQTNYDPERFAAAITTQGERRTRTDRPVSGRRATFESDVACPPTTTVTPTAARRNTPAAS